MCRFWHIYLWLPFYLLCGEFHVCTISSIHHPNLEKLIRSCEMNQIQLEILGMGQPYEHHGRRHLLMKEYLKKLKDDDIVMHVDAWDVLIVKDPKTILEKFKEKNAPFLIALERSEYLSELYSELPPSTTSFRLINGGLYIGYVDHLKKWLNSVNAHPRACDQVQIAKHFSKNEENRKLYFFDDQCDLFLNLYNVAEDEVKIDVEKKTVHFLPTHSTPCVIHANGQSFFIWDKIYDRIIAN